MDHRRRILVVDDDEDIRLLCRVVFEVEGFLVWEAADGRDAVTVARACEPDVVLLDVTMPGHSGWECLRQMREHRGLRDVPVVVLSGHASRECRNRALSSGARRYVCKPFRPAQLVEEVRGCLLDESARALGS